jgi:hypothetical protein
MCVLFNSILISSVPNARVINPFKPRERESERIVRKYSIRVEVKRKHLGESERRFIFEGEKRASC